MHYLDLFQILHMGKSSVVPGLLKMVQRHQGLQARSTQTLREDLSELRLLLLMIWLRLILIIRQLKLRENSVQKEKSTLLRMEILSNSCLMFKSV